MPASPEPAAAFPWGQLFAWFWLLYGIYIALIVVRQRRAPAATLAWIMALCLLPLIGLLVYRYLGPQRIHRQQSRRLLSRALFTRRHHDLDRLQRHHPSAAIAIEHARLIEATCGLPPASCTQLDILIDGRDTFAALAAAIQAAQDHIHLEYYIFEPDQTGRNLIALLCQRARAGVRVRLLVDAVGSARLLGRQGRELLAALTQAGGQYAVFHPNHLDRWRPLVNLRTHRKIVLCDGKTGFTGGLNISDSENEAIHPHSAWRDTHVRLQGRIVHSLQYVFLQDWEYVCRKAVADANEALFPDLPEGHLIGQIIASAPDDSEQAIHHSVIHALGAAQQRIWLATPYFVPTEALRLALLNASYRGVSVRIMLPAQGDSRLVQAAARSYYSELIAAGVEILEYQPRMLHAKTLVVDKIYATIGTANFDYRSFLLNFEIALACYDRSFNQALAMYFVRDSHHCRVLTAADCQRFSGWQNLLQSFARLLSPLL